MPPPKKPKNGPTTVEQFLSKEELQVLGKHKRSGRKDGISASKTTRGQNESSSHVSVEKCSGRDSHKQDGLVASSVSSYDIEFESGSPRSVSQLSSVDHHENVATEPDNEQLFRDIHYDFSQTRNFPGDPPRLVHVSSLSLSFHDAEGGTQTDFSKLATCPSEGSIVERLFSSKTTEMVILDPEKSFHDRQAWPYGPGTTPISQPQPQVFTSDSRHAGLGYRLTTSNTLASLMTRPSWMPFEHSRSLGGPEQNNLHLSLPPSSSMETKGLKPAASFCSVQQHQQQQQQQQQNVDGRCILSSLSGNHMTSVSADYSPPHCNEVFLLKASPPGRGESCASSYLSSLIQQPLSQQISEACSGASSRVLNSAHRTESSVYLHPAFQLPPATTSIRKNKNTSSLSSICSPPRGSSCLSGLPQHCNAKTFHPRISPLKPSQGQTQTHFCGSTINSVIGTNPASSINSSSSAICDNSDQTRDDVRLLDLSLKNRHGDDTALSSREGAVTSPPRKTGLLPTHVEASKNEAEYKFLPRLNSAGNNESDDSNGYINVTSPSPGNSLQRTTSDTISSQLTVIDRTQVPISTKLAGLLTTDSRVPVSTSIPHVIKDEAGVPAVPYVLVPCKTEGRRHGAGPERKEPVDRKSPKEEERMVSPTSCMLPLGGSGDNSGGSAHLQAATSTTPEVGTGVSHHNFLLDVGGTGIGASPPSHMKQEIGGAMPGSSIQAKVCQVCSDIASGFHYGVWSCEGCKAFFKRSIQGPVDYICPATNTCTIDKHRRKSCQACRLRRCYEVGMNKGSQRKERKSNNTTGGLKGKRCRADSSDSTVNSTNSGASSLKAAKRSRSTSILEALQKADLPVIESYHNHSLPATRVHLLNTLIKLADRELVYLINWAKHVPGYTCLTLSDQVHLIECCWMELLLLNCAFRSMEYKGRTLIFAPDFHLERQQWALTGMGDVLEQVSAVSEQMVLHGLNKEELLLLQATVLVNAEVRHMDSFLKIQDMRQIILDVFMEVAGRHQGYGNLRHAPSILLLLTHIRQAGERGITYFQRLKMEGSVTFCDLLTEMLDAHNASGEQRRLQHHQQHPGQNQHHQQHPSQNQHHQQQSQHHQQQHTAAPE